MKLEKRIRVAELQTAIAKLSGNFLSDEESALLAAKKEELERLRPTAPPYPQNEVDIRCAREEVVEDLERIMRKPEAVLVLAQIERETDPARKALLEFHPVIARIRAAQDRLQRWDLMRTWNIWRGEQESKNAAGN